jgi:hypothetical protein
MTDLHAMIAKSIETIGHHVVYVACNDSPDFGYSVGLFKTHGFELVFAGSAGFPAKDVGAIINALAKQAPALAASSASAVTPFGEFRLRPVAPEWATCMLLQAIRYWGVPEVTALQIVPALPQKTLAIPDMSLPWEESSQPVWRGFFGHPFPTIPYAYSVVTNLQALQGALLSEGARWEVNCWEIFAGAGPDFPPEDVRTVPFATLLAIDPTVEELLHLEVGTAAKRDELGPWEPWIPSASCEVPGGPVCT